MEREQSVNNPPFDREVCRRLVPGAKIKRAMIFNQRDRMRECASPAHPIDVSTSLEKVCRCPFEEEAFNEGI
jgi:hypothetical protein